MTKQMQNLAYSIEAMETKLGRLNSKGQSVIDAIKHVAEKINDSKQRYADLEKQEAEDAKKAEVNEA